MSVPQNVLFCYCDCCFPLTCILERGLCELTTTNYRPTTSECYGLYVCYTLYATYTIAYVLNLDGLSGTLKYSSNVVFIRIFYHARGRSTSTLSYLTYLSKSAHLSYCPPSSVACLNYIITPFIHVHGCRRLSPSKTRSCSHVLDLVVKSVARSSHRPFSSILVPTGNVSESYNI